VSIQFCCLSTGAVFIDSGHCLETVWGVYNSFNPQNEEFIRQPPKNAKKLLHEYCHSVVFSNAEVSFTTHDGQVEAENIRRTS
jgi:hypothetical protein